MEQHLALYLSTVSCQACCLSWHHVTLHCKGRSRMAWKGMGWHYWHGPVVLSCPGPSRTAPYRLASHQTPLHNTNQHTTCTCTRAICNILCIVYQSHCIIWHTVSFICVETFKVHHPSHAFKIITELHISIVCFLYPVQYARRAVHHPGRYISSNP